jgi:hypothetical protein
VNLPDEPRDWQRLQQMAQEAPDAATLTLIIAEMNRILYEHEQLIAVRERVRRFREPQANVSLSLQTSQYSQ